MMDDIRGPLPRKPTKLMGQLRALMRSRQMAYKTKKPIAIGLSTLFITSKSNTPNLSVRGKLMLISAIWLLTVTAR